MANNRITRFIKNESISGWILLVCAILGLFLANWESTKEAYHHFSHLRIVFQIGDFSLDKPLHHWVNDGLMAIFFFVVGLELKREVLAGQLSSFSTAILPAIAAIGGMVVPALLYLIVTHTTLDYVKGWGIPMATDIAFVLALLALLKDRIPLSLKIFLTALAIVDDLGAVLVIAFFYTSQLSIVSLGYAAFFLGVLFLMNRWGVRNTWYYAIIGIGGVWIAFLLSGIHATIAGVIAAFFIPANTLLNEVEYNERLKGLINEFNDIQPNGLPLTTQEQNVLLAKIASTSQEAQTPLQHLEYGLHNIVNLLVLPLFAFVNSGIPLEGSLAKMLSHPISLGVMAGLFFGKPLGVFGFSYVALKTGIASCPKGTTIKHLAGMSILTGVGFTMSIFIADLAFPGVEWAAIAKIGVMCASLLAGLVGFSYFMALGDKRLL